MKSRNTEPDFGQDVHKKSYWSWKSQEKKRNTVADIFAIPPVRSGAGK